MGRRKVWLEETLRGSSIGGCYTFFLRGLQVWTRAKLVRKTEGRLGHFSPLPGKPGMASKYMCPNVFEGHSQVPGLAASWTTNSIFLIQWFSNKAMHKGNWAELLKLFLPGGNDLKASFMLNSLWVEREESNCFWSSCSLACLVAVGSMNTWKLVRNAESWPPPQTYWIQVSTIKSFEYTLCRT